jgi:hypothetical protein
LPYIWAERNHNTLIADADRDTMDRYVDALRGLGVRYVLVDESIVPLDRDTGGDDVALLTQAVAAGRMRVVWTDTRPRVKVSIYELW